MGNKPNLAWPDDIPVIVPADLCRKMWHHSDGKRHDLGGWLEVAFLGESGGPLFSPVFNQAERVLLEVLKERGAVDMALFEICDDTERFSDPFLCAAWNEMLHRVGYAIEDKKRRWPQRRPT